MPLGRVAARARLAPSPGGGSRAGLPQGWGPATCVTCLFHVCRDMCSCLQCRQDPWMKLGAWHGSSQPAHRQVLACFRAVADPFRFHLSFHLLSPL